MSEETFPAATTPPADTDTGARTALPADAQRIVDLVRQAGQEWLLNVWPDLQRAGDEILIRLRAAFAAYQQRYAASVAPGRFDEAVLAEYAQSNPERLQALLQALGEAPSADELVMAWRIIEGDEIRRADLHYDVGEAEFELRVELESPLTGEVQTFTSNQIEAAALIRHWGIMRMGEQPVFTGFDPLPTS